MVIPSPLLEAKLFIPRVRRGLVTRLRLSERLSRRGESKLTLVSAPAGFGKTTLVAEWLAATPLHERRAAWLSLDPSDNRAASFWPYVIAALQTVVPEVGATAISLLGSPQTPITSVLATLLNDLSGLPRDIVLVLDDYHVVDASDIQDGMAYLIEHLPPQLHLLVTTRADPALPLGRWRGRGELIEIRAADLRFTPEEAAAYLNGVMKLELTGRDVVALEGRTEGWIAALQLAALSIQGRDDPADFIAGFAGDDRYIVDYLADEVLHRQPEHVRQFLLQTSILGRLTGPLCDAVTGHEGGTAMLEALDRGNLFLVSLDDRRRWYRYHQLFADVLRTRLFDEQPAWVPDLHRRASDWYEHNGDRSEAIRHALAGEDFDRAASLIELAVPALRQGHQEVTALRWLRALPDEVIGRRPVLSVAYAWALLSIGELEDVERRLGDGERWLTAPHGVPDEAGAGRPEMVVVDRREFSLLAALIAVYRAVLAQIRGDVATTVRHAREALNLAPEDDDLLRGAAEALLGLATWASGDLETAHRIYGAGMARVQRSGSLSDALGGAIALADIRITQGRLRDAIRTYEQALQLSAKHGEPVLRATADMYVGLSDLAREQGDLQAATRHLQASKDLGEHMGYPQNRYRLHVVTARIRQAEGDLDGALDAIHEAQRLYMPDFIPDVRPLPAQEARILLRQGRLAEANAWARARGLSPHDDLTYLREFEHVTLARVLLAQSTLDPSDGSARDALALLGRLLRAAEDGQRTGNVIEILVLLALAHQVRGDMPAALAALGRALALGEPEGYVRVFLDEGPPMAALLQDAANRGIAPDYVRRLLTAAVRPEDNAGNKEALIEPLSDRELDVLRLLATDLAGPEIARELVVSLSTVRSHTKAIYAKLGANNRRSAVTRAEELDLLSRARDRP